MAWPMNEVINYRFPPILVHGSLLMLVRLAFLSYLRLATTMAVVAVALVLSFHLKREPSDLELRMARPLGIIFWALSIVALMVGVGNFISEKHAFCALYDVASFPQRCY